MEKEKKSMIVTVFAILTLLVIVGGATYAYFQAQSGTGATSPVTVTTNTTDSLTFIEGSAIDIYVEATDFGLGTGNKTGTTTTRANLIANNYTNSATANYNVFFIVDGNTFEYTTEEQTAELILTVTDPNGNAVTSIEGLNYVTSGGVRGFDITARANNQNLTGSFLIASNYEISASLADGATGTATAEQAWTVTVTLVNLDTDQNANTGKTLSARLVITDEEEPTYEIAQINNAQTTTTATSATVTLDDVTTGTYEIETYYFGVEEVAGTTAMNNSNVLRLGVLAAAEDATWYESSTNSYTFTGLKDDTSYVFYAYGVDSNGIKTPTYATSEIKTLVYTLAQVSASATSEKTSITITASGTNGSGTIEKYYYTVDYKTDGTTEWEPVDGTTQTSYTINELVANTTYNVAVKAVDSNGRETNPYTLTVTTQPDTFASYIIAKYTADGTNGLYYHDGSGTYTNASLEAGDKSYRYTGADPDNYVCFGSTATTCPTDNLYRIIGVFGDQVKLIKADLATGTHLGTTQANQSYLSYALSNWSNYKGSLTTVPLYYWSGSSTNQVNTWSSSTLNTSALNSTYYNYLGSTWTDKIATTTWKVGGNTYANMYQSNNAKTAYTSELVNPAESTTYSNEIGLMYVSDYYYGADPTYWSYVGYNSSDATADYRAALSANWMALGANEWTISRASGATSTAFYVIDTGRASDSTVRNFSGVRPVFYLKSSVAYAGGSGTAGAPYRIN